MKRITAILSLLLAFTVSSLQAQKEYVLAFGMDRQNVLDYCEQNSILKVIHSSQQSIVASTGSVSVVYHFSGGKLSQTNLSREFSDSLQARQAVAFYSDFFDRVPSWVSKDRSFSGGQSIHAIADHKEFDVVWLQVAEGQYRVNIHILPSSISFKDLAVDWTPNASPVVQHTGYFIP